MRSRRGDEGAQGRGKGEKGGWDVEWVMKVSKEEEGEKKGKGCRRRKKVKREKREIALGGYGM